jgi:hypothetical protein
MGTKIRLDLEALDVQSFVTAAPPVERGTVKGNACSESTCHEIQCTCTDPFSECVATEVGCSGGTGTGGTGGTDSRVETCATGFQLQCSCG